jgi:predicted enzyme related to lactoylglutathione lyase
MGRRRLKPGGDLSHYSAAHVLEQERNPAVSMRRPSDSPVAQPLRAFAVNVIDEPRLASFYRQVFGWSLERVRPGLFHVTPGPELEPSAPVSSTRLVEVADLDAALRAVQAGGGRLVFPKMPLRDLGFVAYCQDPDGNVLCLRQRTTRR